MHKQIFVNLAVDDLPRSKTFFDRLGMHIDPKFSNDQAACVVVGDNIYAMLLVKDFFKTYLGTGVYGYEREGRTLSDPRPAATDALNARLRHERRSEGSAARS